jgi:hypothetical protein
LFSINILEERTSRVSLTSILLSFWVASTELLIVLNRVPMRLIVNRAAFVFKDWDFDFEELL